MTVLCYYHVTYKFQSGFALSSCLNVKELLARSKPDIWHFWLLYFEVLYFSLEKFVWINSFLEPATLLKINFFLNIFQALCLKVSEDFFHRTYICSNSKYVVHGLLKIIQNYVYNKINKKLKALSFLNMHFYELCTTYQVLLSLPSKMFQLK